MVRFAILLHSQSPAAYSTLRNTGVLTLPGETTLRDYTNWMHHEIGFNRDVIEEVRKAASKLEPHQ
jgi:hypothetical protein